MILRWTNRSSEQSFQPSFIWGRVWSSIRLPSAGLEVTPGAVTLTFIIPIPARVGSPYAKRQLVTSLTVETERFINLTLRTNIEEDLTIEDVRSYSVS